MEMESVLAEDAFASTAKKTQPDHETAKTMAATAMDESARLRGLDAEVRDQGDLERDIGREADKLLFEQANERDKQRLEKTNAQRDKLQSQIRKARDQILQPIGLTQRTRLKNNVERMQSQIEGLDADFADIEARMLERERDAGLTVIEGGTVAGRLPNESQRDFLIRTGKITPFSKFGLSGHGESSVNLEGALLDAEEESDREEWDGPEGAGKIMSHRNLRRPGFASETVDSSTESDRPKKKRRVSKPVKREIVDADADDSSGEWREKSAEASTSNSPGSRQLEDSDDMPETVAVQKGRRKKSRHDKDDDIEDLRGVDDGNESVYQSRLRRWCKRRSLARRRATQGYPDDIPDDDGDEDVDFDENIIKETLNEELYLPHPEIPDTIFDGGFKIPGDIYPSLFDYQKTGVQWLHELYTQQVGGIIGDEMGLGKTIQMISFLAGLQYSKKLTKPLIVVCPATVMKQWVNEFHRWWPPFRVTILHSSGSGMINVRNESSREDSLMDQIWDPSHRNMPLTVAQKSARRILNPILNEGGVLITTYSGLQTYAPLLIPVDWEYAVLDEGHKIRNPNTAITIYCKELRTANRIILSGTPMQNNLVELWSLFDFVFPMRLGTLVNFRNQFDIPIRQGGYANASNLQVQTAFQCAETLKDAISPYLLQRFKIDVAADLPKKSEQVLFCKLSKLQREEYKSFLAGNDMSAIMSGKRQVLYGVDILRKICNHPDLQDHRTLSVRPGYNYGNPAKSGKMQVVGSLLELWRDTGHKTLLFAQHRIMLDILERYVRSVSGLKYRRMDGNTPIQVRQSMVDEFNTDPEIHVFLLTTKVGGLGINLTGADRVIIYDPDWNPSTDLQARERAWRLGQKREVTIYRLMTAGTIEEKIYHRQIFKQFLTNKILKDPKQRQTFHLSDLHDLFSLGNEGAPTETSTLFSDALVKYSNNESKETKSNGTGTKEKQVADDFRNVAGISSIQQYAGEVEEEAKAQRNSNAPNSESRVMEGIFARSGIHSAVEHDDIIGGGKKPVVADRAMTEREAKKVAAEAARELRRAGEVARTVPVGTPTWTGQFGVSGRPQETTPQRAFGAGARNRGGGVFSSSLLAGLQQRQGQQASRNSTPITTSPAGSRGGTPMPPSGKDFGKMIRDYLVLHGGGVYTQMLIDHFNRFCTTPQATMEFKETLKVIATLEKGGRGRGRWVLKEEYKKA